MRGEPGPLRSAQIVRKGEMHHGDELIGFLDAWEGGSTSENNGRQQRPHAAGNLRGRHAAGHKVGEVTMSADGATSKRGDRACRPDARI